jgi:hypothetical protein
MNKVGPSEMTDGLDCTFCYTILVVSTNTAEGELLIQ